MIIAWKIARNVYGNLKHSFCRLSLIKKQEKLLASSPSAGRLIKHHFLHIRSSLGTKFQPKLKFLNFRTKLTQKGYFQSKKKKKKKITIKVYIFEILKFSYIRNFYIFEVLNFTFNKQTWFFGTNFPKKFILLHLVENIKNEHHYWILQIWIRLSIKLQLEVTIFFFWAKFAEKGYFLLKTEKVTLITELFIFDLV